MMDIGIRKLTPDLAEDYVRFFDATPHDDGTDETKCYCVCWCNDDCEGKDFSSAEKRRELAFQYVRENILQGYLAYCGDKIVGWCNANTKADCLKCGGWRWFMGDMPAEEPDIGKKIKSIYCFVIAPEMKRKGVATQLTERVCEDAKQDGFDFIEAYPNKEHSGTDFGGPDFKGPLEIYKRSGFEVYSETVKGLVVRKRLQ